MTIERAREILWDLVANLSDKEIEDILNNWKRFVNVALSHIEAKIKNIELI